MMPRFSFTLATGMIVISALWLTGILQIQLGLTSVEQNPTFVLVAVVMSFIAALLFYEW